MGAVESRMCVYGVFRHHAIEWGPAVQGAPRGMRFLPMGIENSIFLDRCTVRLTQELSQFTSSIKFIVARGAWEGGTC